MIPRIIHRIWFGGNMPTEYENNWQAWQRQLPNYEFKTWTEEDIKSFKTLNLINRAHTYAGKADIARLEIMIEMGGIYLDTDIMPFHHYDFSSSEARLTVCYENDELGICSNGFFMNEPGEPILKTYLELAKRRIDKFDNPVLATGPYVFGEVLKHSSNYNRLPSQTFYPYKYYEAFSKNYATDLSSTVGIHIWGTSWFSTEFVHKKVFGTLKKTHDVFEIRKNIHLLPQENRQAVLDYADNVEMARSHIYNLVFSQLHADKPVEFMKPECFEIEKIGYYYLSNHGGKLCTAGSNHPHDDRARPLIVIFNPELTQVPEEADIVVFNNKPDATDLTNPVLIYCPEATDIVGYMEFKTSAGYVYVKPYLAADYFNFLYVISGIRLFDLSGLYL